MLPVNTKVVHTERKSFGRYGLTVVNNSALKGVGLFSPDVNTKLPPRTHQESIMPTVGSVEAGADHSKCDIT